ncbi:MAG: septation protein SepH [Micrococcales bacterium]
MRELNPIGREDDSLILVSQDGEQFSVTVDETLMRTLKEHRVPDASGIELTPRQIQDAIRAGESIAEISERSGTRLGLVERFAHPVLEELQHMVDLALSIRIELPADRFNEIAKKPFGEVVGENLASANASDISWRAKRTDNSLWEITVHYLIEATEGSATWSFDPRKYILTPETTNAQALSKPGSALDTPLRPTPKSTSVESKNHSESVITADKLDAFRSRRAKAEAQVTNDELSISEKPVTQIDPEIAEIVAEVEIIPESTVSEPHNDGTQPISLVPADLGEESQETPDTALDTPVSEQIATPNTETPRKTRAPMPSWDEIVRGTHSDDGEAF